MIDPGDREINPNSVRNAQEEMKDPDMLSQVVYTFAIVAVKMLARKKSKSRDTCCLLLMLM